MSMTRLKYDDEDRKIRSALQEGMKDYHVKLAQENGRKFNRTQDEINGLDGLKKFTKKKTKKVEDSEEDDDFQRKQAINKLLRSYQKSLSSEVILSAIEMYEQGKSYDEIERYLQDEQRKKEILGKVDYYGGRTLREARKEIEDDELELW